MVTSDRPTDLALSTIPPSDAAFREHVHTLASADTPRDLEARLRRGHGRLVEFDSYTETVGDEFVTVCRRAEGT